jgi:hypothetical protein
MFGLMHGLGFASGLKDAGLPDGHIPTALLFFSIGVEVGHFLFIGFVLSLIVLMLRAKSRLPSNAQQRLDILDVLPPYAIGSVAMFWVIQRLTAFWGLDASVLPESAEFAKPHPCWASGPPKSCIWIYTRRQPGWQKGNLGLEMPIER